MNLQKQLRCVYLHAFFSTLRFTDAVWVALLAARGFSLAEIGLAEGMFHLTSLLCEVPSGMAADLLGRRRTLIFGGVLGVFSALAMASAPGLGLICTAMALKALGYNMLSGTAEALIYDSLKMAGRKKDYIKVDANASICMKIATALGSLASLLAGVLRYAGYYLADAVSALLSALAVWFLHSMQRMNESISSDRRATLISVDSMTYSLLMIPASPMLGWLGDAAGSAGVGPCLLGAMVAASGLAVAAKTRYNRRGA